MKILYYYIDAKAHVSSWPKIHYIDELERAGHVISIFDPYSFSCIDKANEELLALLKENKEKYDLFINPYGFELLYVETIKQIKTYGIPTLLICCDNLHAPYLHRKIAPFFDLVWLTSFETMPMFRKWGCNCIFLPYAANPHTFQPKFSQEINVVGFVGTPYGTRVNKINELLDNHIPCALYSDELLSKMNVVSGKKESKKSRYKIKIEKEDFNLMKFPIGRRILWSKVLIKKYPKVELLKESEYLKINPSITFDQMNQLYSNFSMSLGITEVWNTYILKSPVHKMHLRTFEIPMCGGLQFIPYVEELAGYFEDEKEIVMYKSKDEYLEKAKFYLQDAQYSLRMQIKQAARKRAEAEHTWINRFNVAFKKLNLQ